MTPENFAYWLQGFAELTPEQPSAAQWQAIRDHLALVFAKKTPMLTTDPLRPLLRAHDLRPQTPLITC